MDMGLWRTLYRETRLILGFSAPAETPNQFAERIAGEVKSELGGKLRADGEDWVLESQLEGRPVKLTFHSEAACVSLQVGSELDGGPDFTLIHQDWDYEPEPHCQRKPVAGALSVEAKPSDLAMAETLFKSLPTGTRGNLTSLLSRHKGCFNYRNGLFQLLPNTVNLEGPSAHYNTKSFVITTLNLIAEVETAWSQL